MLERLLQCEGEMEMDGSSPALKNGIHRWQCAWDPVVSHRVPRWIPGSRRDRRPTYLIAATVQQDGGVSNCPVLMAPRTGRLSMLSSKPPGSDNGGITTCERGAATSSQSQKALKLSHNSLLEKVEELTEQLKEETQRNITLESQLETASISQRALEESQKALKLSHNSLLEKVEELTEQLKEETQRNITLESQLETASISQRALEEFQERITDLENEKALLKQDYDKLLESTLDLDTQRSWQEGEAALRKEVCRLEDALHSELSEKRMPAGSPSTSRG
ncbi:UNVERIFIED_CONTAM: hypothetical protein FKN15_047371 [Acipenser sinensis]